MLRHPFISKLHLTFQDEDSLYYLLDLATGGDLYALLDVQPVFPEDWALFYTGSLALALRPAPRWTHPTGRAFRPSCPSPGCRRHEPRRASWSARARSARRTRWLRCGCKLDACAIGGEAHKRASRRLAAAAEPAAVNPPPSVLQYGSAASV